MTESYARVKPLGTCPHASCSRGNKVCRKLAAGGACLKTHFATHHDWDAFMTGGFHALDKFNARLGKLSEEESWASDAMFHTLCKRIDERAPADENTVH